MFDRAILSFEGASRILVAAALFELLKALLLCGQASGLAIAIVHIWEGQALADQIGWICLFAACFIAVQVVRNGENRTMDAFALRASEQLRSDFLQAVALEGPVGIAAQGAAALSAEAIEGVSNVKDYLRLIIPKMMGVVVVPFVILVVLFCFDWISGVIALVCYPFILIYMRLIGSTAKAQADKRRLQFERMSNSFIDTAQGIDTIKAFGTVETFRTSILHTSEHFRKLTMKTLRIAMLSSTVLDIFSTLALAAVAIMLGFRLVEGTIMFLPALTVLLLVPDYFKPIKDFGSDYHASLDGRTSLEMIQSVIAHAQTIPPVIEDEGEDGEESLCGQGAASDVEQRKREQCEQCERGEQGAANDELQLSLQGLAFDYGDDRLAWESLELQVRKPCKVGLFGPSGSGKTTLLNMIAGFCSPAEGCIQVNGREAGTLKRASWLNRVAYIPQSPTIFTMSLRDNLTFYNPAATDSQVYHAIKAVGLSSLLDELPDGLSTVIGASQRELSGGESQRVAVARALLAPERDVWVLDEPTAHLDIQTECELKERMLPLMQDKLVFLATHRLHWADDMDVVLDLAADDLAAHAHLEGGEVRA